jgi:hypothetical protein
MPLLSIWNSNPETISQFTIEQVVSAAGNGRLLDNSDCSLELREYLSQVSSEKLSEYADYCLTTRFDNNGKILQDVVNEFGRRLDYRVTNGRYQGSHNLIGNDGLWLSPEGHHLVVEVKTTDAYSISVDTIAKYRKSLQDRQEINEDNSMLLVVGRYDTGQLEAQVRGSRHAWDMRLISVDSLVNLVNLKENTEDEETSTKIRSILVPLEYTRLDRLIDVIFTTAKDVENVLESEEPKGEVSEKIVNEKGTWEFTETALIDEKRTNILRTLGEINKVKLVKKSRALYWNSDRSVGVACTISKRYEGKAFLYWYAFHPTWQEFLSKTMKGFFVLGCMDMNIAFSIPLAIIQSKLVELNTTTKDGKTYWHIQIPPPKDNKFYLQCHKSGNHLDLTPYTVNFPG